jgi:hypothetical protein
MITSKEKLEQLLHDEPMTSARAEYLLALIHASEDMLENAEIDAGDPSWACGLDEKSAARLLDLRQEAINKREELI